MTNNIDFNKLEEKLFNGEFNNNELVQFILKIKTRNLKRNLKKYIIFENKNLNIKNNHGKRKIRNARTRKTFQQRFIR